MFNFYKKTQQTVIPVRPGIHSVEKQRLFLWHANGGHILTDTLLLTCQFLFEQKQVSLQTPCSSGLWALLLGRDLFTQPRDKVGLLVHPGATITTTTFPFTCAPAKPSFHPPLSSSPHQVPRTGRCCRWRPGLLGSLRQRCVWSPCAQGVGPGLIRSSMMK